MTLIAEAKSNKSFFKSFFEIIKRIYSSYICQNKIDRFYETK